MNSSIVTFVGCGLFTLIIYTLILIAIQKYAAEKIGRFKAVLSFAWWASVDAFTALTSFFLADSTFQSWFPSEYLGGISSFFPVFQSCTIVIADLLALVLTMLCFILVHKLVFRAMILMQDHVLSRSPLIEEKDLPLTKEERPQYKAGFLTLLLGTLWVLVGWETPVIAVRIAKMLNSERVDDILSIGNIWTDVILKSWLMTSICLTWSVCILVTSWCTVKAKLAYDNATNLKKESAEATESENPVKHSDTLLPNYSDITTRQAEMNSTIGTIPIVPLVPTADSHEDVRELVAQNEDLNDENDNLRRELAAHRDQNTRNVLGLRNNLTPARNVTSPHISSNYNQNANSRNLSEYCMDDNTSETANQNLPLVGNGVK
jgi:hypothetical protein